MENGKKLIENQRLVAEWHPTKNEGLKIEDMALCSHKKVWWLCEAKHHEWEAIIKNRSIGNCNCPICNERTASPENNLLIKNPTLAAEWHPTKNGDLKPTDVCVSAGIEVWWQCEKFQHEWPATINHRNNGRNCPFCNNKLVSPQNNLLATYPELCKEWHPTKNGDLKPENFVFGSHKKVWWLCEENHEWPAKINKRSVCGKNCPYCNHNLPSETNNLLVCNPILSMEWHPNKNGILTPKDFCPNSNKKVWWLCEEEHEYELEISARNHGKRSCPICGKDPRISKVANLWLEEKGIPNDKEHREVLIKIYDMRFRVDGYDPETKTVREFLGDYWHGNPKIFKSTDINRNNKKTYGELYQLTLSRFLILTFEGYTVIYRWESDTEDKVFVLGQVGL